jgi:phosphoglycerate kinase
LRVIQDIKDLKGKKVLVRVDFNVPLKEGRVRDDERIRSSLATINFLTEGAAAVALVSHLGRPEGKPNREFSLFQTVGALAGLLNQKVKFLSDCVGPEIEKSVSGLRNGDILVLENLRFHPEEEKNDPEFAQSLARGFDYYVNDAFSASHRAHASITGVTEFLPSFAGINFQKEVEALSKLIDSPKKPFVVVSGGAKISDKIDILKSLVQKADVLLVGGGMANTFLMAEGYEVGKSLAEADYQDSAEEVIRLAEESGAEVMLPDDVVVTSRVSEKMEVETRALEEVQKSELIVDIGPKSVAKFAEPLRFAGTIFWNGPMGITEYKSAAKGTEGIAKIISESRAYSVIGGGDTLGAVKDYGNVKFDFVSTAGGATLEYLANGTLPALEVLK